MATVKLFGNLRQVVGKRQVTIGASSVGEVVTALCEAYPEIAKLILDNGSIRQYYKIMVNGHDIQLGEGLDTTVIETDQVSIFPPIAGGGKEVLNLAAIDIGAELDYSKLEAGKVGFARVPFRVSEMAAEAAALFAVSAAGKGITLTCETAPGSERLVLGDPLRLRQVLLNLLGNALKFTDHGHVRLRIQPQGVPSVDAPRLAFSVEDSGVGIAPEVQAQLFQPFVQADQSAHRTGSGLGLAISQRLVRGMGGEITVDSVPGRGSTFRFPLSFAPAPAAPSPPAPAVTGAGGPSLCGRVLLVEDNPVNRVIAVTMSRRAARRPRAQAAAPSQRR